MLTDLFTPRERRLFLARLLALHGSGRDNSFVCAEKWTIGTCIRNCTLDPFNDFRTQLGNVLRALKG